MIFAEGTSEAIGLISTFGPAGLAIVVGYFLMRSHREDIEKITTGFVEAQKIMASALADDRRVNEKRDDTYRTLEDKKIEAVLVVANVVTGLKDAVNELSRRIELVEDAVLGHERKM